MKPTTFLKLILASFMFLSFAGCEKTQGPAIEVADEVKIMLDVDDVSLESVNIRVRHDGAPDMLWVYLLTPDLETPAQSLLENKVADDIRLAGEIVVYNGQNKSIFQSGLQPKFHYRFICQAIDGITGKLYGEPAELQFRTRRDPAVFEVNDNWSIERGERSVNPSDKMEYDNFEITSSDEESYVVLPIKVSDFEFYYKNDMRALFEDFHSDFGLEVGASQWKNVLKEGDITWSEQRLRSSDWIVYMIGIDDDGELSGLYQEYRFTIEQEVATDAYNRWLGKWEISDKNGLKLFDITVLPSENNLWFYLAGWEGNNLYFDTADPALMIETFFNKESGKMEFVSQYVNTMVQDTEAIDFYFSGTFYYGGNYVIDLVNYKMAETSFSNADFTEARVDGLNLVDPVRGLNVPIQAVCYFYYRGSQPSAISLEIPSLPLSLKKIQ